MIPHKNLINIIPSFKKEKTTSLQFRSTVFFFLFVVLILFSFSFILMILGVFDAGSKEGRNWLANELAHISEQVSSDLGKLSYQGNSYAQNISDDISSYLDQVHLKPSQLQEHTEQLEPLLSGQATTLLNALENTKCSGSFLILDATVNPKLPHAEQNRCGIFFKRTEPNSVNIIRSKIHYLRGPASIARENSVELLGQWQMEFNVQDSNFFQTCLETATANQNTSTSRLYYWSNRITLKGNSESALLLCIPLRDSENKVYGMCGLEFSSMLFKLNYSPNNDLYPRVFVTLSPIQNNQLNTDAGLIAGNSYLTNPDNGTMSILNHHKNGLITYQSEGQTFIGMETTMKLYPSDSPYQEQEWRLAILMPKSDWGNRLLSKRHRIYLMMTILLIICMVLAYVVSRRFVQPITTTLTSINQHGTLPLKKTNIAEIDDLLVYLEELDQQQELLTKQLHQIQKKPTNRSSSQEESPNLSAYHEFVTNIETLSVAERAVFDMYMQGFTAKEIAEKLYLSMNTIKTHNKRIFMKLNVGSRKELMVYVQMMNQQS